MKDGRTHLAHKAEHAVDVDTGALVAVTVHGADVGDTSSLFETALVAATQLDARATPAWQVAMNVMTSQASAH